MLDFTTDQDDAGRWHWTILNDDGSPRACSAAMVDNGYPSEAKAKTAARAAAKRAEVSIEYEPPGNLDEHGSWRVRRRDGKGKVIDESKPHRSQREATQSLE